MTDTASSTDVLTRARHDTGPRPEPRADDLPPVPESGPRQALTRHLRSALVLGALLLLAGLVHGVNAYGAPQSIDDEGTYVAQAWAVLNLGELTHYTYWYDHPPLGWLQLAGYAAATGAFERAPHAVAAGREFLLVTQLISVVLLWLLARRLAFPRWGAALAVVLFSVSPLAVQFHRSVYLDNIATPWVLGAFVLALSPQRRLTAFAGAGVAFAVAVLTKETSLLLLPVLVWVMWRTSARETRGYAFAVAGSLFALIGGTYVLFAVIKGELLPGADRTDLLSGVLFQLSGREASGSVFTDGTLGNRTLSIWLQLDVLLPALSVVAALGALAVHRLRPFAVGFLLLLLMLVRPGGYLPVPFVIAMLPLGALLVAGVAVAVWQRGRARVRTGHSAAPFAVPLLVVGVLAGGLAVPAWGSELRGLVQAPLDQPMREAERWIQANVPQGQRILTDDALWVDLVESGRPREEVVWYYKPDTDPAVPRGWENYAWVVSTDSVRSDPASYPTLDQSLQRSTVAAIFGSGPQRVEVRQVMAEATTPGQAGQAQQIRQSAGLALADNPGLDLSAEARASLVAGDVDGRVLTALATLAGTGTLAVESFPVVTGESGADRPRRTVVIDRLDGRPVEAAPERADALRELLAAQSGRFAPAAVELVRRPDAVLSVTFPFVSAP